MGFLHVETKSERQCYDKSFFADDSTLLLYSYNNVVFSSFTYQSSENYGVNSDNSFLTRSTSENNT